MASTQEQGEPTLVMGAHEFSFMGVGGSQEVTETLLSMMKSLLIT
jgi:hypothetical protein